MKEKNFFSRSINQNPIECDNLYSNQDQSYYCKLELDKKHDLIVLCQGYAKKVHLIHRLEMFTWIHRFCSYNHQVPKIDLARFKTPKPLLEPF